MNIRELKEIFEGQRIPKDLYSLSGGLPNESYCIEQVKGQWAVYYSERGIRSNLELFDTEEDACLYLYECVKRELE